MHWHRPHLARFGKNGSCWPVRANATALRAQLRSARAARELRSVPIVLLSNALVPVRLDLVPELSDLVPELSDIVPEVLEEEPDELGLVLELLGVVPDVLGAAPELLGVAPVLFGNVPPGGMLVVPMLGVAGVEGLPVVPSDPAGREASRKVPSGFRLVVSVCA